MAMMCVRETEAEKERKTKIPEIEGHERSEGEEWEAERYKKKEEGEWGEDTKKNCDFNCH